MARKTEITRSIRTDQEFKWRDVAIRLRRVTQTDLNDKNTAQAELVVRTNTQSQDLTLQIFESQFVEDYEFIADDIRASGNVGEGRMTLTIRYVPQGQLGGIGAGLAALQPTPAPTPVSGAEETTLKISSFPSQNALIIRYQNPSDLERVEKLIVELDKPIAQVNIETRFVTVNEERAKEFSSEWNFLDPERSAPHTNRATGGGPQ